MGTHVTKLSVTTNTQYSGLKQKLILSNLGHHHKMTLQLPHTFRPLKRSYKQKPPPDKTRNVERETGHVLSNPGDFLLLDKFTSTGFINKIYNMEVREDDIWVVTPPKCGTTWMQELVWLVANNMDFDRASTLPQVYRFPFLEMESLTYWNEENRDVEIGSLEQTVENQPKFFANSMKHVESLSSPRFIKTHHPISMLPPDLLSKAKVIYVGRNVKDICVSSFYHERPDIDFSKWADAFRNGEVMIGNWFEHMREASNITDNANFKSFWYEDMKDDFETIIKEVAAFLGKEIDEVGVEKLVAFLDINKMRKNPMVNKEVEKPPTEEAPSFIRKGIVGDWRTHFTSEQSQDWDRWIESELERTGIQGMRG